MQLPCGHQDHERWHQLEAESISSCTAGQDTGVCKRDSTSHGLASHVNTAQNIKKQKSRPTKEIIRFITQSNFPTRFLPLSFFILKIHPPFHTLSALQTLRRCKDT